MSKKSKDKIRVLFCGNNAQDVTGSQVYIETPHRKILLECGMVQTCGSTLEAWKENTRKFDFKVKDIDYLFVGHHHQDHVGLIPLFVKRGARCPVICTSESKAFMEILWRDSAHIIENDATELTKKFGREYVPYYDNEDVDAALGHVTEYPMDEIIELDEYVKFRFVPSGHIINAAQLELWITENNVTKKILYTSDMGNEHIEKDYVRPLHRVEKADIVISESTYARQPKIASEAMRALDLEKIKTCVNTTVIENKRRILFPSFALDRTQTLMTALYDLFSDDPYFNVPIFLDSPMSLKTCSTYTLALCGEELEKWKRVIAWDKFHFVGDYIESRELRDSQQSCIVIASSGFLVAGRSVAWLASLLPHENDRVVFIGYAPPGSLAYTIKNMTQKTVSITGKRYSNKCQITILGSFSSHIQRDSLLSYLSSIDCSRIYLVHGEREGKLEFAKELQEEISRNNKTGKVICTTKGMEAIL